MAWLQYVVGAVLAGGLVLLLIYPREVMGVALLVWLTRRGHRLLRRHVDRDERGE